MTLACVVPMTTDHYSWGRARPAQRRGSRTCQGSQVVNLVPRHSHALKCFQAGHEDTLRPASLRTQALPTCLIHLLKQLGGPVLSSSVSRNEEMKTQIKIPKCAHVATSVSWVSRLGLPDLRIHVPPSSLLPHACCLPSAQP